MAANIAQRQLNHMSSFLDAYAQARDRCGDQFPEFREALSGNVAQWIRIWGEAVGQIGFINLNYAGTTDPQAERRISSRYSYGRQLGRITEALAPLVEKHKSDFTDEHQKALNDFQEMAKEIENLKQASVDEIVDRVRQWKNAKGYATKLDQLSKALDLLHKQISEQAPGQTAKPEDSSR